MSKKQSTKLNDTPVRLPRLSQVSEIDLMEINLSQEEIDEIIWSEKEESFHQQNPQKEMKIKNKENESAQKRRKRLMKFDSTETEKRRKNKIKSSKDPIEKNKVLRKTTRAMKP